MGRKKIDEEILEYAKELYLEPDENGFHRYSAQDIADKILQKFNVKLTRITVYNWAKKYGWERLWEEASTYGVTEAIGKIYTKRKETGGEDGEGEEEEEIPTTKSREEELKEQLAKAKRDKTIMDLNLVSLSYRFILENGIRNINEAIRIYEIASRNLSQNDIIEKLAEEITIIIPREILPTNED
jgi:ribosomal protein S24E